MKQDQSESQTHSKENQKEVYSSNSFSADEMDGLMDEALGIDAELESQEIEQGFDQETQGQGFGPEACGAMLGTAFDVLAARRGEHWRLKPAESQMLGVAFDGVLEKYLPGLADKVGPEAGLALAAFAIFMPRIKQDQEALENAE